MVALGLAASLAPPVEAPNILANYSVRNAQRQIAAFRVCGLVTWLSTYQCVARGPGRILGPRCLHLRLRRRYR